MLYDMIMKNNIVDLVGSDLILEMLSRLNPFREQAPPTELQRACLAFAMGLVNSGAAVAAALSTGGLSILAEGLLNRALGDSGGAQEVVTIE